MEAADAGHGRPDDESTSPLTPQLPSLAPRPDDAAWHATSTSAAAIPGAAQPLRQRRRKVVAACDTCRNRKAKCDGTRPRCNTCSIHGRECVFFTNPDESRQAATRRRQASYQGQLQQLQASHDALRDLIAHLVSHDNPSDVHHTLNQIRTGAHPVYPLLHPQFQYDGRPPPPIHTARSTLEDVPVTVSSYGQLANSDQAFSYRVAQDGSSDLAMATGTQKANLSQGGPGSKRKRNDDVVEYEQLRDLLASGSQQDVQMVVKRLRDGHDISTVLAQLKQADLLLQLSLPAPETRRRYELPTNIDIPDFLRSKDNPYLNTLIYETDLQGSVTSKPTGGTPQESPTTTPGPTDRLASSYRTHFVTPYGAAELHEPIIDEIKPSEWTTVLNDDRVLRRLLRTYFLYCDQNYPAFHKDLFLEDMKRGRSRFCSPLLVNAIFAAAAHADVAVHDSDKFWLPHGLAYRFLAEARRLWDMELGVNRLTTVQAGIVLNSVALSDTTDKIGSSFMIQASAMAHALGLLTKRAEDIPSAKMKKATTWTAWCMFGWDVITSYFYFRKPAFQGPPACKLPDPAIPGWYSETWLRYPGAGGKLVPSHSGAFLKASFELRAIQHQTSIAFFGRPEGAPPPSALEVAHFQRKLYEWFDALPIELHSQNLVLPSHLRVHMEYYTAQITLARVQPVNISELRETQTGGQTATESDCVLESPSVMHDPMTQAVDRLETLFRIYNMRHGFDVYFDSSLTYYFAFLGSVSIQALMQYYQATAAHNPSPPDPSMLPSPDRLDAFRSILVMCSKGLIAQGRYIYVGQVMYYALRNTMPPRERARLLTEIKEPTGDSSTDESDQTGSVAQDSSNAGDQISYDNSQRRRSSVATPQESLETRIAKYNQSQFPLPIISIVEDPKDATLSELAERYRKMLVGDRKGSADSAQTEDSDGSQG